MQREGHVDREEHRTAVLVPRQEITGADRQWAERYGVGDVVRYSRGSKALGIEPSDYARVEHVDAKANEVTVKTDDGRTLNYDPRRLQGVMLYRKAERAFAAGDRVQMTAPNRERGVPNRELGTVERVDPNGRVEIQWDSGRTSTFEASEGRHLDYGYAVTSHSSKVRPPAVSSCTSRPNVRARSSLTSDSRTWRYHGGSTMRGSTPTTR